MNATAASTRELLARLECEWRHTRLRHDAMAVEWGLRHPALEGCTTLDEVVATCRDDNDAAVLALVVQAQRGCPVAGRTLLRALTPLFEGLARRDPRADLGDYLGACWPVLMARSTERCHGVLAGLALDTRRALVRERAGLWVVSPSGDHEPQAPVERAYEPDADQVLASARRLRLLPAPSMEVMSSVYLDGLSGADAAARHGISADMVRYRCSSGMRRLRAERSRLLADLTA